MTAGFFEKSMWKTFLQYNFPHDKKKPLSEESGFFAAMQPKGGGATYDYTDVFLRRETMFLIVILLTP